MNKECIFLHVRFHVNVQFWLKVRNEMYSHQNSHSHGSWTSCIYFQWFLFANGNSSKIEQRMQRDGQNPLVSGYKKYCVSERFNGFYFGHKFYFYIFICRVMIIFYQKNPIFKRISDEFIFFSFISFHFTSIHVIFQSLDTHKSDRNFKHQIIYYNSHEKHCYYHLNIYYYHRYFFSLLTQRLNWMNSVVNFNDSDVWQ